MTSEEAQFLRVYLGHAKLVTHVLEQIAHRLIERGRQHDFSKLLEDEFAGFVQINKIAREHPYGSPEYRQSIREIGIVPLHYSRNAHHPEYHPNGLAGMGLLDFVEMVADWKAASQMYGKTPFKEGVKISKERFKATLAQAWLIDLIVEVIEGESHGNDV